MDILSLIENDFDPEFTLEEKIRFLYLKSCEFFSYDSRFGLGYRDDLSYDVRESILDLNIDLRNVQTFNVVCTSWSRLMQKLCSLFLNVKCDIKEGPTHSFCRVDVKDGLILDACLSNDLARCKVGLSSLGFNYHFDGFLNADLQNLDERLGYVHDQYFEYVLGDIKKKLKDENILSKICEINALFSKHHFREYGDAKYYLNYLMMILLSNVEKKNNVKYSLYLPSYAWIFVTVYEFLVDGFNVYYSLAKDGEYYEFKEISEDDAMYLKRNLKCNVRW